MKEGRGLESMFMMVSFQNKLEPKSCFRFLPPPSLCCLSPPPPTRPPAAGSRPPGSAVRVLTLLNCCELLRNRGWVHLAPGAPSPWEKQKERKFKGKMTRGCRLRSHLWVRDCSFPSPPLSPISMHITNALNHPAAYF